MASAIPIVQAGNPVLRQRAREVTPQELASTEIQELIRTMYVVMRAAPGVGLAAPQIGVSLRILVMEDPPEYQARLTPEELKERERTPVAPRALINPVLRRIGSETATFFEGCLSVNGYTALVERSLEVEVTGLDERSAPQTVRARGWHARILQHEVDHLDGTLYVDRMMTRSFCNQDVAHDHYAGRSVAEIRKALGI
jgi:peptide deformylase